MNISAETIEKITNSALTVMTERANKSGGKFTSADILACAILEPNGNTAFRLAEMIAYGVQQYLAVMSLDAEGRELFLSVFPRA